MRALTNWRQHTSILGMANRIRPVGQATRAELARRREAVSLSQGAVAERGEVSRSVVGWIDGKAPGSVTVDTLVAYARGLGTQGWRVLRDVEEALHGEG
jgi:transcriptional regulator with XRE-family HTH domain